MLSEILGCGKLEEKQQGPRRNWTVAARIWLDWGLVEMDVMILSSKTKMFSVGHLALYRSRIATFHIPLKVCHIDTTLLLSGDAAPIDPWAGGSRCLV